MPYTHYHDFSFHTHRRRRRRGHHHREISRRQRPFQLLVGPFVIGGIFYLTLHFGILDRAITVVQDLGPYDVISVSELALHEKWIFQQF